MIVTLKKINLDGPQDPLHHHNPIRQGHLIHLGQHLNLTCPFEAPFYHWNVVDQPAHILSEEQTFYIKKATLKDSNRYICHAIDGYGRNSAEMSVRVVGKFFFSFLHF